LLFLYVARVEGRAVSVSSIGFADGIPPTTALRWLALLEQKAAVSRREAGDDGRRTLIEISDSAHAAMTALLCRMREQSA
jgi:DNA-binding MarR family transcriptional regulator